MLVDNDRGASRYSRKDRPAYRKLVSILTAGDVLVTWEASRAQRDLKAYLELRDLCAERGVLWCYSGKVHDLAAGDDRFTTGLDALLAEREVEFTRERVLRSVRARVAAGKPLGKPPYGYKIARDPDTGQSIGWTPDPVAAPIVREIVRRVLAGDALYAIGQDLTARRVLRPRGASTSVWDRTTIRRIAENPAYAGLVVHRGEVAGVGVWEALISREQHQRAKAIVNDPKRLSHRGTAPRWLLSGIAVCGVCGSGLRRQKNNGYENYICKANFCAARKITLLDEWVEEAVIRRLESQELAIQIDGDDSGYQAVADELRALRQRFDGFAEAAAAGELTPAALARVEARLQPQIEATEARLRRLVSSPMAARMAGGGARERWERLSMRDRRDLLQALVQVRVFPLGRGRPAASGGEKVELTWR